MNVKNPREVNAKKILENQDKEESPKEVKEIEKEIIKTGRKKMHMMKILMMKWVQNSIKEDLKPI